jgi:hypothetical protein
MKMIKLYQIRLTDQEVNMVNGDCGYTPRIKAYFDRMFDSTFKAENFQYYDHVANIKTQDFETAFELTNKWNDPSRVEKLGRCSSMSVGDILEDDDGKLYRCALFGFDALGV